MCFKPPRFNSIEEIEVELEAEGSGLFYWDNNATWEDEETMDMDNMEGSNVEDYSDLEDDSDVEADSFVEDDDVVKDEGQGRVTTSRHSLLPSTLYICDTCDHEGDFEVECHVMDLFRFRCDNCLLMRTHGDCTINNCTICMDAAATLEARWFLRRERWPLQEGREEGGDNIDQN